jgi:RND family efflux transporter MFP subunit
MPLVSGQITEVNVQLGDFVKKGQILAKIYSTELAQEQMEYLRVDANLGVHEAQANRYRKLAEIGAISQQEKEEIEARLQEHHAEHASHRQKLLLLGMTDAQIDRLNNASQVRSEVPATAPSSGVITARGVNNGQVIAMTDNLFSVTDLSSVWVIGNIYEKDFGVLRLGAKVLITTPSYPGRNFTGAISYIDPSIDPSSRTAQIRIEVPNPGQMLKLGMFVDVALNSSGAQEAIVIPKSALQTIGSDQVVFVSLGAGQFQRRKLQLAEDLGDVVRVVSGVSVGEKIVTEGSFFLRAEMGRSGN